MMGILGIGFMKQKPLLNCKEDAGKTEPQFYVVDTTFKVFNRLQTVV